MGVSTTKTVINYNLRMAPRFFKSAKGSSILGSLFALMIKWHVFLKLGPPMFDA